MTAQTTLGGVDRDALLRIWLLFFAWAFVNCVLAPYPHWKWFAWLLGSALTCVLIYRRSLLAGIVGYLVCGTAAAQTLSAALSVLGFLPAGHIDAVGLFRLSSHPLLLVAYQTALAFVPAVVLTLHVASRHRLLRAFEGSEAERRHGRIIPPSSYYLITRR